MEWKDRAIILGIRRHGETSVIAEVMTPVRGRHLGLVRGGRSRSLQPVLQPGNVVEATWRARLDEHLGEFKVEPIELRAAGLMETPTAVYGIQAMAALLRLLPERDPHPHLFQALAIILDHLHNPSEAGELFIRFELAVLNDLGFGLDLTECAATGLRTDLAYVSPKSGRAVNREAAAPWKNRMLVLPSFLGEGAASAADQESLEAGFQLTSFFLNRHVYEPRGLAPPAEREGFIRSALKALRAGPQSAL
ncbi:DNA repair protein RecO [Oryzifoliimicrobium ureilyticus]|uniref:DNA repair protein RecO n=1 Tax=Oryzifoliimicrobium ureilyticus TaxID=3113724 RepID=UPI0030761192